MPDPRRGTYQRLATATLVLTTILVGGATVFHQLGDGRWSWFDCFYMTVITLSTVGFGEMLPGMEEVEGARIVTLVLIILGSGTLLYFMSNLTALIIEGDLGGLLLRRRMQGKINKLEGHIIVCGIGNTGIHIVEELLAVGTRFVVIEHREERVRKLQDEVGNNFLWVLGDATDDHVLEAAGITRCAGVIAALHDDKENLFVTITASALNKNARIVAKAIEPSTEPKLLRAGATSVVSPNFIGGMRLVSEMIRPAAVEFIDRMLRDPERSLRIDEAHIDPESRLVGQTLAESDVRETGALVIAVRQPNGDYVYKPSGELILEAGAHLIVIAKAEDLTRLRETVTA